MKLLPRAIVFFAFSVIALWAPPASAAESIDEANALFYQGNTLYAEGRYADALLAYDAILQGGREGGNLYYNIGNGFLKLNRTGYAILFYERAMRIMPYDSDLRSNLSYALTLVGRGEASLITGPRFVRALARPVRSLPLSALALLALIVYLGGATIAALTIANPVVGRRVRFLLWISALAAAYLATAYGIRYHNEVMLERGIVVVKKAACSYEPIEKSQTHYTLPEGAEVFVLDARGEWRRVRNAEGKVGWVRKEAVEVI